jgi:thioredoxin reductase (NADPH)
VAEFDAVADVVIVGAGPTGLACGIELKRRGVRAVLIDKGCVVNSLYNYPTNLVFFTTPELLEIGDIPMTSLNEKPVRGEALKYYRRVANHYGLDVRQYERVLRVDGADGAFVAHTEDRDGGEHRYSAKKVIFATGYYDVPNLLGCPGEDLPKVLHYYKEPHPYYDQDVVIVGAKNSAVLAALELWWSGSRVTMVHRGEEIHKNVKYWLKPNIENRIKNGEIPMYWRSRVAEIRADAVVLETPEGRREIRNQWVFAMTGYQPDTEFLEAHGIRFDAATRRPQTDPTTLESDRKGIHLAGVIVAGMHTHEIFIENGRFHGKQIAEAIAAGL